MLLIIFFPTGNFLHLSLKPVVLENSGIKCGSSWDKELFWTGLNLVFVCNKQLQNSHCEVRTKSCHLYVLTVRKEFSEASGSASFCTEGVSAQPGIIQTHASALVRNTQGAFAELQYHALPAPCVPSGIHTRIAEMTPQNWVTPLAHGTAPGRAEAGALGMHP